MSIVEQTACILCSRNCGLRVEIDGGHVRSIRGDDAHPVSKGYLCQKAARLPHYQDHADRLTAPLRRRPDGGFEEVSWDAAIAEVAARLRAIRAPPAGGAPADRGASGTSVR